MSRLKFEPDDMATRIAYAGMVAIEAEAQRAGVELGNTIIALSLEGQPEGELNATVHAHLSSDQEPEPVDVLAVLCAKARTIAEQAGIPLEMFVAGRRA